MKNSVLTTGMTGLVGSRIQELLSENYYFHNMDLTTGVDITNKDAIRDFVKNKKSSVLIHLAAFTDVNAANKQNEDKNGLCYKVNVDGTKNIAEICKESDIHLIHFSTDFVFSGNKNTFYTEEDKPDPIEWYGKTKYISEESVKEITENHTIVRIGFPYRAKFELKPDFFAKTKKGIEEKTLNPQFTDMIITPTYIDDLAMAIELIVQQKPTGTFHLNSNEPISPYDFAQKIAKVFNLDNSVIKKGSLDEFLKTTDRPYQKMLKISNSKIRKQLNIDFKNIEEALNDIKLQLGQ